VLVIEDLRFDAVPNQDPVRYEDPGSDSAQVVEQQNFTTQSAQTDIVRRFVLAAREGKISKLRAWRVLRNLDQSELARRAGMTQPEVSRAERLGQTKKMKGETLERLAGALHIAIEELL
jgi:DNA-binding Xre family transcriptional regulator